MIGAARFQDAFALWFINKRRLHLFKRLYHRTCRNLIHYITKGSNYYLRSVILQIWVSTPITSKWTEPERWNLTAPWRDSSRSSVTPGTSTVVSTITKTLYFLKLIKVSAATTTKIWKNSKPVVMSDAHRELFSRVSFLTAADFLVFTAQKTQTDPNYRHRKQMIWEHDRSTWIQTHSITALQRRFLLLVRLHRLPLFLPLQSLVDHRLAWTPPAVLDCVDFIIRLVRNKTNVSITEPTTHRILLLWFNWTSVK